MFKHMAELLPDGSICWLSLVLLSCVFAISSTTATHVLVFTYHHKLGAEKAISRQVRDEIIVISTSSLFILPFLIPTILTMMDLEEEITVMLLMGTSFALYGSILWYLKRSLTNKLVSVRGAAPVSGSNEWVGEQKEANGEEPELCSAKANGEKPGLFVDQPLVDQPEMGPEAEQTPSDMLALAVPNEMAPSSSHSLELSPPTGPPPLLSTRFQACNGELSAMSGADPNFRGPGARYC